MPDIDEDMKSKISDRVWKCVGLAGDILKEVEENPDVKDNLEPVLQNHAFADQGVSDVFKKELYTAIECLDTFRKDGKVTAEDAKQLNASFEMLKDAARTLDISIK